MLIVKVLNQTKNKIRLPKGLFFGLLRLSNGPEEPPEPEITIIQMKTINNFPRVDLENIKIEPSESSDESIDPVDCRSRQIKVNPVHFDLVIRVANQG